MEHKKKDFSLSWFFRWFLDNKAITVFLVTLLLGLNIFVLSKISLFYSCSRIYRSYHAAGDFSRAFVLSLKSNCRFLWRNIRSIVWSRLRLSLS